MLRGANRNLLALATAVLVLAAGAFFYLRRPPPPPDFSPEVVKDFFHKFGCTNCHDVKNPLVGPPFEAIAARYKGDPRAEEELYKSVREGSRGKWFDPNTTTIYGIQRVMPAQDRKRVPDPELRAMIRWILKLGGEK